MTSFIVTATATPVALDRLFSGRSDTYDGLIARYGRYMPEAKAANVAKAHGATLAELNSELWWSGWTPAGVGTTVHVGSLLAALGY